LGIFLAILLPLLLVFIPITKKLIKFLLIVSAIVSLAVLLLVNFWVAWIILLVGTIIILVFGISKRESFKPSWLVLPMLCLVISVFFGVFRVGIPGLPATPLEVSPSQKAGLNIAKQALEEKPLLGTGAGTFVYNYSKFKSETINQTAFWSVRFATGASDILDKLSTLGILGSLSFGLILGFFLIVGFKRLTPKQKGEESKLPSSPIAGAREGEGMEIRELSGVSSYEWILSLAIFSSWLALFISFFLYPVNVSIGFLFWVLTACFLVLTKKRFKSWTLEPSSGSAILVPFLFILILVLGISVCFMEGQRYWAAVRYQQGILAWQKGENQKAVDSILRAVSLTNGNQDNYWRDLSQIYLLRISEELQKERTTEETSEIITPLINNAVNSAKVATDASPKNVANWSVRGFIYSQMMNILEGADDWAIKSYQETIKLEPTNSYLYTELGKVYSAKGETEKAKEEFQTALDLKSDYAAARFQIALIYVGEEKIDEAIVEMEEAKRQSPFDVGVAFQLGFLYYNDDQFNKAKAELERVVNLDENYSNARYFLGLIYDREGKTEEAISQFEKIEVLNPDNAEVKTILANLRAGRPALEGITPAQPPIEERPEEVLE
jgi:tetratricopeptide (TPR) repeat protein